MNRRGADNVVACVDECSGCKLVSPAEGALRGWRLVLVAAGIFISPLVLAVLGAAIAPDNAARQAIYAGIGLVIGIVAAASASAIIRRKVREPSGKVGVAPGTAPNEEIS